MGAIRTDPDRTLELEELDREPERRRRRLWPLVLLIVLLVGAMVIWQVVPSLLNPFARDRVERTGPAVLEAIEDLSSYRAATGHFEVIVDLEEDSRYLPSFISGERTLFVAVGTVDATVDFSGLGQGAVEVSEDRRSVTLNLPSATLSDAVIDPEASYVYDRERGLIERLQGAFSEDDLNDERELYLLAEQRLQTAATQTNLVAAAEQNTRGMLEGLLGSLGFTDVTVEFS
jgi:hypothetical protein